MEVDKARSVAAVWEKRYKDLRQQHALEQDIGNEKLKFLEAQKDRAQQDLEEATRRFQEAIYKMQKNLREESDSSQLCQTMEAHYANKVQTLTDEHR